MVELHSSLETLLGLEFSAVEYKTKTRTVSFRVPEHIIIDIEREAKTKLVSTNVLINQILSHYVNWGKYEQKTTMYPIPSDLFKFMLHGMNEKSRGDIVDIVYNSIRDWSLLSKKKFDIHTCLQVLQEYCTTVGIVVDESVESGIRSYIIRHNLGINLSEIIGALVEKIFFDLVKINVDCQLTKNSVMAKLKSKLD